VSAAPLRLAFFVTPHGFGHAARAAALCRALHELRPELELTLFTSVPRWFFEESLDFSFDYRELACDVGLVQKSAIEEDLDATVERLETFWTEAKGFHLGEIQKQLRDAGVQTVVCDIAPLGLLAARESGLPAVLVENFTWDWIYEPLVEREPRLAPWVDRLRTLFALADLRIRAEPVCGEPALHLAEAPATPEPLSFSPSMKASLASSSSACPPPSSFSSQAIVVPPIARRPKATPGETRARLGLAAGRPLVLVSFGGVPWSFGEIDRWRAAGELDFVVPGGSERAERRGNVVLLPHHSPVFHPDLVAAADVVVGKLGYSTVAEAHAAGSRLLFLPRHGFREHAVLEAFVRRHLPAESMSLEEFRSGVWVGRLPRLLAQDRPAAAPSAAAARTAAEIVARFVK
jgi:UDP:flavonoid glycosyltransferase YjiC (YdhE family)